MMDAIARTQQLERVFLSVEDLEPQSINPNEMSDAEFNMLADNIEQVGITDPVFVVRKNPEEITPERSKPYRIVGGEHRWTYAKVAGFDQIPCTVVDRAHLDEDKERFQVVRMNVIRGRIAPQKFVELYQSLSQKHAEEILAESFGFTDEEEFKKLIGQVKKNLPQQMQANFEKASKELKTIDDLAKLLNHLFSTYGDTLPYGFMCLDFGGKDSIWLRMSNDTRKAVLQVGEICIQEKRTVDDVIGGLIRMLASGKLSKDVLVQLIAQSDEVEIPETVTMPTAEVLAGSM